MLIFNFVKKYKMLKKHRIAIARIFADLIKADRIVDSGEMECWQRVCARYAIDSAIQSEAVYMPLGTALEAVSDSGPDGPGADLLAQCRSMTLSDGCCAHSEALMMVSLMLVLDSVSGFNADVISIPRASFDIDMATALYIESEFDPGTNRAIERTYRAISREMQLAGIHFVYLPYIIDHYRNTSPGLFRQILSFLAPSLSVAGIDNICRSLMRMTTAGFCKDILCNKCGIAQLRRTYPSLLIKIGNSYVGEDEYANYLRVEVGEDILADVQRFVDCFSAMLSSEVLVVSRQQEKDGSFHFHGFYKQLLDIFLIRKNIRSTVVIDPYKEEIYFPELDVQATGLHRREKALYTLMLCQGADGVDFSRPRTVAELARHNQRIARICARYNRIYSAFGGDYESAPDLSQGNIRGTIFSILKKRIAAVRGLYNPDDYNLGKNSDGSFVVNLEPELVYIKEEGAEPVPLRQSRLYRKVML